MFVVCLSLLIADHISVGRPRPFFSVLERVKKGFEFAIIRQFFWGFFLHVNSLIIAQPTAARQSVVNLRNDALVHSADVKIGSRRGGVYRLAVLRMMIGIYRD